MPSRIDQYKDAYRCKHDGETILKTATHGMLMDRLTEGAEQTLYALGVTDNLHRKDICSLFRRLLESPDDGELAAAMEAEVRNSRQGFERILNVIRPMPSGTPYRENGLREIARERIDEIMRQVIRFCEDEM